MSLIHVSNLFVSTKKIENKKDPGIPNNYPFKEQLLQQIADQKLKAAEEKERQKLDRRAAQDKARQLKKGANNTNTENKSAAKSKATDASKSSEKAKAKAPAKGKKEFTATAAAAAVATEESDEDGDAPYNFGEHFTATNGELHFQTISVKCHTLLYTKLVSNTFLLIRCRG